MKNLSTPFGNPSSDKYKTVSLSEAREQYLMYSGLSPKQVRQMQFSKLHQYRFIAESPIKKPDAIISIDGHIISTKGNLTTLAGLPKTGKSALIAAILSGTLISAGGAQADLLGLSIKSNESNKAVLHVDSEQSRYDHYKGISGLLGRTTGGKEPDWFYSYNFRTFEFHERQESLQLVCEETSEKHSGIHIIVLDGGADFVQDTNDQKESNEVVRFFEKLATKFDCPVVIILHSNPGTTKGRGHFGSQLERKSESVISVSKNGESGISTIKGNLLRNSGSIPQLQFVYDTDKGHHVYFGTLSKAIKKEEKKSKLQQLVDKIFKVDQNGYTYKELYELIMAEEGVQDRTAKDRIKELVEAGVLVKSDDPRPLYSFRPLNGDDANQV